MVSWKAPLGQLNWVKRRLDKLKDQLELIQSILDDLGCTSMVW